MTDGMLDLPLWGYIVVTLALTHITIIGVTVYLHRHQAHRGVDLHPAVAHFFRFWLWLTTGMITREWVAVHRKHHAKCEAPEDPHSPQVEGIGKVLWQGSELYRTAAEDRATLEKYGHSTPNDWLERNIYIGRNRLGIALMFAFDLVLFGVPGITVWAVQMLWIPFWAAGVINGIGHWWGYRNFETPDASTNIVPFGVLIGGEEMHNNHHAFGSSAKFSSKWWEFDLGWMYIRLLSILGLARVRKVAPKPVVDPAKPAADTDTVMAVIASRFQVMSHYARHVVFQVCREEMRRADGSCRSLYKRARSLLVREESLINEKDRRDLEAVFDHSRTLATVYQFKQRLQGIWERTAASQNELVQALQEWCRQAEATGIEALQEFARSLKGYSLKRA